jgi:hypothetical protein
MMAGLYQADYDPSWPSGWELDRLIGRLIFATETRLRSFRTMIGAGILLTYQQDRGYWAQIRTPFVTGDLYWAGFTPLGATGWNGVPDYYASGPTLPLAVCYAALLSTRAGAALLGCPWAAEAADLSGAARDGA